MACKQPAYLTYNFQNGIHQNSNLIAMHTEFVYICVPFCPTEKCRSEEDLKSMDSRNKITQDMLQPKVERSFSDEEGSSDYLFELSDNDSDSSDIR